ncbi:MAG: YraN family protein [Thermodesulfobacteriota bacterium]
MTHARLHVGKDGESIAASFLEQHGVAILEQNYKIRLGEIDIIARDGDTILFIEVKSKKSDGYLHPKYSITNLKQKKISMVALHYLKATRQSRCKARFDVITVISGYSQPKIDWIQNAFELSYF